MERSGIAELYIRSMRGHWGHYSKLPLTYTYETKLSYILYWIPHTHTDEMLLHIQLKLLHKPLENYLKM